MFGWAIEAELMKSNPARDVRRKKYASNGFYTWTFSDLTAFENRHRRRAWRFRSCSI